MKTKQGKELKDNDQNEVNESQQKGSPVKITKDKVKKKRRKTSMSLKKKIADTEKKLERLEQEYEEACNYEKLKRQKPIKCFVTLKSTMLDGSNWYIGKSDTCSHYGCASRSDPAFQADEAKMRDMYKFTSLDDKVNISLCMDCWGDQHIVQFLALLLRKTVKLPIMIDPWQIQICKSRCNSYECGHSSRKKKAPLKIVLTKLLNDVVLVKKPNA